MLASRIAGWFPHFTLLSVILTAFTRFSAAPPYSSGARDTVLVSRVVADKLRASGNYGTGTRNKLRCIAVFT